MKLSKMHVKTLREVPADAEALLAELRGAVPSAQRIGAVGAYRGGKHIFLR